jgi:lysozyme
MTVLGFDVAKWQDDNNTARVIDFEKMKKEGAEFVFIRATIGLNNDEDFVVNWENAKKAGLLRGAYHFFYASLAPQEQAQRFINRIVNDPGEINPVFDLEKLGFGSAKPTDILTRSKQFVDYFETDMKTWKGLRMQPKMLMYTNPDIITNFFKDNLPAWFINHELWIAHYGVTQPRIGTQFKRWLFWQQTDRDDGLKYGVESKQIDRDVFNGDLTTLKQFCGLDIIINDKTIEQRLSKVEQYLKDKYNYIP